jgi:uncharacterized YccA/Bax inhibitor family protein
MQTLAYWEGLILFGGLFGIIFWKLVRGGIPLDQLLDGDIRDSNSSDGYSSYVSGGRVQSLLVTAFAALYYLLQTLHDPKVLPALPRELIEAVAGSQALYLGGKAQAMLLGRLRHLLK